MEPEREESVAQRAILKSLDIVNSWSGPKVFLETFGQLSREIGLLHAANFCWAEVCNGGFEQFFGNTTGVMAPEAVEGFIAIGQPQVANIVSEAMAKFGLPYPRDRRIRENALEGLPKGTFDELDRRFYSLYRTEAGGTDAALESFAINSGL